MNIVMWGSLDHLGVTVSVVVPHVPSVRGVGAEGLVTLDAN